jgi:hypothetical protein
MERRVVELARCDDCDRSGGGEKAKSLGGTVAGAVAEDYESGGQAGEREGSPREEREEPGLRRA